MSNELADRLEDFIKQEPEADAFVLRRIDVLEAIAALRADSVAAVYEKADGSLAILPYHGKFPPVGTKLYAAPSRETDQRSGQMPASEQYEQWKKYPNSFSEPTHEDWLRELSSLRAEKERAEAERDAAVKDAERASWLIDTANREDIEATLLSRRQPHEIRALIDVAREGEQ